jgi:hypothetical protein
MDERRDTAARAPGEVTVQLVPIFTAEGAEIAEIQITFRLIRLVQAEICLYFSAHFAFSAVKIAPQLNGYFAGKGAGGGPFILRLGP